MVGGIAGVLRQEAVGFICNKASIDDTLDVFAVHGVGGIFGTVIIAVFGAGTWAAQLGGLAVVGLWTGVVTWVLVKAVALVTELRVDAETEYNGLGLSVHGGRAYELTSQGRANRIFNSSGSVPLKKSALRQGFGGP